MSLIFPLSPRQLKKLVLSQLSIHLSASNFTTAFSLPIDRTQDRNVLLFLGDVSLLAFFDLSASFDTTDHSKLLHRFLGDFGTGPVFTPRHKAQSVSIHCYLSEPFLSLSVFYRDQSLNLYSSLPRSLELRTQKLKSI